MKNAIRKLAAASAPVMTMRGVVKKLATIGSDQEYAQPFQRFMASHGHYRPGMMADAPTVAKPPPPKPEPPVVVEQPAPQMPIGKTKLPTNYAQGVRKRPLQAGPGSSKTTG